MNMQFAETLKKLRIERGLSQREIAEQIFVTRPTVARWENGNRLPDAVMISRLSQCLDAPVSTLLSAAAKSEEKNVGKSAVKNAAKSVEKNVEQTGLTGCMRYYLKTIGWRI